MNIDYMELGKCSFYFDAEENQMRKLEKEIELNESADDIKKASDLFDKLRQKCIGDEIEILINYCDTLERISQKKRSFYYRNGFIDGARLMLNISGTRQVNCNFIISEP